MHCTILVGQAANPAICAGEAILVVLKTRTVIADEQPKFRYKQGSGLFFSISLSFRIGPLMGWIEQRVTGYEPGSGQINK
jgi:hypothetical protein